MAKLSKVPNPLKHFEKERIVFLFDPGHGGIIDGEYQTKGKRSPIWDNGTQLFEGVFNRDIVDRLVWLCADEDIPCINLINTNYDIPLQDRVNLANDLYYELDEHTEDCIYISIHANAGGGTGFEVFTSPGQTKSDDYAEVFINHYKEEFPELRLRADTSDGDHDKEAKFFVLRKTIMPAVLIECAFMDTFTPDCEILLSEEGKDRIARAIFNAIKEIYGR